jgi:hypothetical protein
MRLEQRLFPRNDLLNFIIIACLSIAMSFLLIGRQVYQANWGLIDDHEVFKFLGSGLHLSPGDIWSTLLAKTEVGTFQGRFRPSFYLVKVAETSLFGANVHLWYLANVAGFAIFLGSIWWFMRRFTGIWLAGVLTAYISLLPLWAGVWSRLGPSEIGGAACVGAMIFAAYFVFFSGNPRTRNINAVMLTLATLALVGMKETFIPLAGATAAVFLLALIRKQLSLLVVVLLSLVVLAFIGWIALVVSRQVAAAGTDYYANSIGLWPVLVFAAKGLFSAIQRTWWLYVIPILFLTILNIVPRRPLSVWIRGSWIALGAYGFLVATYVAQCALYRSKFPVDSRYDFPAMLLVPLTCCILACDVSWKVRTSFSEKAANYAQLAAAAFLFFAFELSSAYSDKARPLAAAVQANIATTNAFYTELQNALRVAESAPERPIILEAYGPGTYEAVSSLAAYLSALGARNHISVRLHPAGASYGKLYDSLEETLSRLQTANTGGFTPLQESLANLAQGCISIGINGPADARCSEFQVKAG